MELDLEIIEKSMDKTTCHLVDDIIIIEIKNNIIAYKIAMNSIYYIERLNNLS